MRPRVAVAQPQRPEQPEFFITRLTAYLTAIGTMRQKSEVEVPEFSLALQDVTQRQLRQDLADLGFSDETTIPLDGFARAIRSNIHKARIASQTRLVADPELPSVGSFLAELTGHADDLHARRARAIETAFEFASHEPSLFLLGHGLLATEAAGSKDKGIVAYNFASFSFEIQS